MITYAERSCFTRHHLAVFAKAVAIVGRVSDRWGNELRCHELARAVRTAGDFGLLLVDGKCGPIEHSWLEFKMDGTLLDVYAPGRLPAVQIVDPIVALALYRQGHPRSDLRADVIAQLIAEMREEPNTGIGLPRADGSRG